MNKAKRTYQTPSGEQFGAPEVPGARWYGVIWRSGHWIEVACIDQDDTMILVSGPRFHGWVLPSDVHPDDVDAQQ